MLSRLLFPSILCLSCRLVYAQDLGKPIDYEARALPMRVIVAALAKQGGVKLQVDRGLEEEPLILRLNHVPLKEAMDKIADVFAADWVDHGDFWRLQRSAEKIAALRKRLQDERTRAYKASIDELVKLDQENGVFDEKAAERTVLDYVDYQKKRQNGVTAALRRQRFLAESRFPAMRLAIRALSRVDPSVLAELPAYHRVVLSTDPNRFQIALPEIDPELVRGYEREQKTFADVIKRLESKLSRDEWELRQYLNPIPGRPSKVIVYAMPRAESQVLGLTISLLNEKGEVVASDYEALGQSYVHNWEAASKTQELRAKTSTQGFALGPIAGELAAHSNPQRNGPLRPVNAEAAQALLHPTQHDPLSWATADIVLTAASKAGLNAICLVQDYVEILAEGSGRTGKTSFELFTNLVEANQSTRVEVQPEWLIVRPADPVDVQRFRTPRPALEAFLQSASQRGYASVEDAAALWGAMDPDASAEFPGFLGAYLIPGNGLSALWADKRALMIYASLGPEQREIAATEGLRLKLTDLSQEQLDAVRALVYEGETGLSIETNRGSTSGMTEPTELFPRGLPADALLTIRDKTSDVAFATSESKDGSFEYAQNLNEMAWVLMMSQIQKPDDPYRYTGFRMGQQRVVDVKVALTPSVSAVGQLTEDHRGGNILSAADFLKSLPAEVRQKLEDQIAQYRARRSEPETPGSTTSNAPPARP